MLYSVLSANSFEEGERLFSGNRPAEAIPYFQKNLLEVDTNPLVYIYLGVAYMQTGQNTKALDTFIKGTTITGTNKKVLFFNAGNVCFTTQDYNKAIEFYTYAISADSLYAAPYLNRANSNFKLEKYENSISDYTNYLAIEPNSTQKENVQAMINALQNEINTQKENALRLAQEEEKIKAEQERLAAEKAEQDKLAAQKAQEESENQAKLAAEKAAADTARRKKLLEEVAAELQQTESTNLTSGTEGVIEYQETDSDLD
jgi:tetratricopeptide (TPR) repeat protein